MELRNLSFTTDKSNESKNIFFYGNYLASVK